MIKKIITYNLDICDINTDDFRLLYEVTRRDSTFAGVVEDEENIYAIRDHLGIVPLFYRMGTASFKFSFIYADLLENSDLISELGLTLFLTLGTTSVIPMHNKIKIVPPGGVIKINKNSKEISQIYQYIIKPSSIRIGPSLSKTISHAEELFDKAMEKLIKNDTVGLLYSGGMDSSLIASYLKKKNIKVHAYTAVNEKPSSDEITLLKRKSEYFKFSDHSIIACRLNSLNQEMDDIACVYQTPHGTSVSSAISKIWMNSKISKEKQLFFAQNSDTLSCNVGIQVRVILLSFIPSIILKRIKIKYHDKSFTLKESSIISNYVYLKTSGMLMNYPLLDRIVEKVNLNKIQKATIAGLYFGHTPTDGPVIGLPSIGRRQIISNPFYDMDFIEYMLSVPAWMRIGFIFYLRKKIRFITLKPIITKRIIKGMAKRSMPLELIQKKKGFTSELSAVLPKETPAEIHHLRELASNDSEIRINSYIYSYWVNNLTRLKSKRSGVQDNDA